jgi:hypothetical protein
MERKEREERQVSQPRATAVAGDFMPESGHRTATRSCLELPREGERRDWRTQRCGCWILP